MSDPAKKAQQVVLSRALGYPQAAEDHPWEHTVVKVPGKTGKIFVFVDASEGRFSLTAKLPRSSQAALTLPFTEATGYGLGKSGWITASFEKGEDIPVELMLEWLDESYRAVAPKRAVKALDGGPPAPAAKPKAAKKKPAAAKKTPSRPSEEKKRTARKAR
jgi:predicted DNA-binding protein (MmcQ/YjbR family)